MRFLDVAAGSGALSIPAARLGARVLATDLSPAMLDLLARRARDEELSIETRVMDGHALELEDDSFDMAGSQFGVMLFPDMPRGIAEMARVVRPGGRVLMNATATRTGSSSSASSWPPSRPPSRVRGPADGPAPAAVPAPRPRAARTASSPNAGLGAVEVETITEETEFRSGEHLWDWIVHSNPIAGAILAELDLSDAQTAVSATRSPRSSASAPAATAPRC